MKSKPTKEIEYKRGDVVRVVVSGKTVIASVVATVEGSKKTPFRYRLLTETGKTISRDAVGMEPTEAGDREKLSVMLAKLV